jgi:predicted RNase H-like HicB family nuclease
MEYNPTMKMNVGLLKSEEGYSAWCPGLPGCWSQGESEREALENIESAIQEYLLAARDLLKDGERREVEVQV